MWRVIWEDPEVGGESEKEEVEELDDKAPDVQPSPGQYRNEQDLDRQREYAVKAVNPWDQKEDRQTEESGRPFSCGYIGEAANNFAPKYAEEQEGEVDNIILEWHGPSATGSPRLLRWRYVKEYVMYQDSGEKCKQRDLM